VRGLAGFMGDSSIILQSDQLRRRATRVPAKIAALRTATITADHSDWPALNRSVSMIRPGSRCGEEDIDRTSTLIRDVIVYRVETSRPRPT
jgi:hypothetical protein